MYTLRVFFLTVANKDLYIIHTTNIACINYQLSQPKSPLIQCDLPITVVLSFGAKVPLFGRTVYALGAVVLILNDSRFFDGLISFRSTETGSLNKPEAEWFRLARQHQTLAYNESNNIGLTASINYIPPASINYIFNT